MALGDCGWEVSQEYVMILLTLYSKYEQASDLWQQLELTFELEFDL